MLKREAISSASINSRQLLPRELLDRMFFTDYSKEDKGISVYPDCMGIADSTESSALVSKGHSSCVAALIFNTSNGERALLHIQDGKFKDKIDLFLQFSKGDHEFVLIYWRGVALCFGAMKTINYLKQTSMKQLSSIELNGHFKVKFAQDGTIYVGDGRYDNNYHKKYTGIFNTKNTIRYPYSLKTKIQYYLGEKQSLNKTDNVSDQEENNNDMGEFQNCSRSNLSIGPT